ncbi:N-acetyltransferase DgcN [Sphingomonas colocasiae]|uniref:DUF1611 domain-containing protein n=1 Tax=Sphingomonas colocasiae TaxID=1848973 RepID=A0ABS7PMJ5_9SPHN|nr:N-acetyltransferase DgcN [Sphingomonas colocasiae]MBY8822451.1 DUF1611 domain-containing protein [Sphingomonas colocasiae]
MTSIPGPYLLFLGDAPDRLIAKTACGILQWRPELCLGQFRLSGDAVDIGLPDMTPAEARAAGAGSIVIGIAPLGGGLQPEWIAPLLAALEAGLDIASGLHARLRDHPALAPAAAAAGQSLHDVRRGEGPFPVASGRKRTGKRLLTVGTDCAIGKKYTALAIHRALRERGIDATFRATGQTGILIAGGGIAIDSTISDFAAGAAETLSPDNGPDHWDVIEGQGSLFHPGYAAVSLALLHGSQPDAIMVCHDPARTHIDGYPDYPLPSLQRCIEDNVRAAQLTNPSARVVGISLDTSRMSQTERHETIARVAAETGLPVIDPIATGAGAIVDALTGSGA